MEVTRGKRKKVMMSKMEKRVRGSAYETPREHWGNPKKIAWVDMENLMLRFWVDEKKTVACEGVSRRACHWTMGRQPWAGKHSADFV